GIGTFNDRLRDGARGGGPFSGIQEQGFLTGLYDDPNATDQGTPAEQLARLLLQTDWVRVGMAGGLADPQETINYIEAHDNDTLFDAIAAKAPVDTPMDQRVRMQNLGISIVGFAQGVPFYHAGVELLRSKSMDRNSYNSGDWFNKIDWTHVDNNWGVGLPPAPDNQANWSIMRPLLANPALNPTPVDIGQALAHFQEVLAIRKSTRLLRLRSAQEIESHLFFHNTGPDQIPGLIVDTISDVQGAADHQHAMVAVLLNSRPDTVDYPLTVFPCRGLQLHPLQKQSADPVVRTASFEESTCTFHVPGRTAAVFVKARPADEQLLLLRQSVDALVTAGALNGGQGNALLAKLRAAEKQLQLGRYQTATNQVNAFIQQVEDFVSTGVLTADQADSLLADAEAIVNALNPQPGVGE
ncbi:MAG TPA: alpha-1,6-glucosidase domain-containing protein, partial [Thermoanaerobaculia bacterium]|nr:alpha-1,6-glucosidase domain-containing protein [Thermoanaerobaculia bacterium]